MPPPMIRSFFLLFVLALLGLLRQGHSEEEVTTSSPSQCTLYLAPSSIEGAGLGIFTSVEIGSGEPIGPPEIVHNLLDMPLHQSPAIADESNLSDYDWLGDDYQTQTEARRVASLIPGLNAAINSHPGLHNTIGGTPSLLTSSVVVAGYDSSSSGDNDNVVFRTLDRTKDPGAGAISYYGDLKSYATRSIKAGSELFSHYSDMYFADRPEIFGMMPLATEFNSADKIVRRFVKFVEDNDKAEEGSRLSEAAIEDLWSSIVKSFETEEGSVVTHEVVARRLRGALPDSVDGVRRAAQIGTAEFSLPDFIRSKEWLEDNGKCMDHVRPGQSRIPQAGRGAFASRFIPLGAVVLPLPLVHINRSSMEMYDLREDPQHKGRLLKGKQPKTKQLLYNYCFSHPDSSLLLYPYSSMSSYVNHAPGKAANVELRWNADEGNMGEYHHPEWLNEDPATVLTHKPGLMLEFVAIRDIQEDEEILLDYGEEWAKGWEDHVKSWRLKIGENEQKGKDYVYPHELNAEPVIRTKQEQENNPYPSNVDVACFYVSHHSSDGQATSYQERSTFRNGQERKSKGRMWADGSLYGADAPYLRKCQILERREVTSSDTNKDKGEQYMYTVLLESDEDLPPHSFDRLLFDVPRKAIKFVDMPYKSDQHLDFAFRHEINVPNDVWPAAWMDLKSKN